MSSENSDMQLSDRYDLEKERPPLPWSLSSSGGEGKESGRDSARHPASDATACNFLREKENVLASCVWLSMIWLLPLLGGCDRRMDAVPASKAEPPLEVKTTHPIHGPITRSIFLPAEIKANQQATLYAKVTGYLKTIKVDKGDSVKEGDVLAEIEVPELLSDAAKYKAEVEVADLDYKRITEARKKAPDLVIPLTVDAAKGKYEVAKASLERAETLLTFTKIIAPFSGIVTRRMLDAGAFVPAATAGSSPQTAALLTIADFNIVRVQTAVPESDAPLVSKGQPLKMTVDGLPGKTFQGVITRFAYSLDDATKTMLAESEIQNPKLELRPGMYANVRIGIERREDALIVPSEAVLMEKANASVFTVVDNKAKKRPVKIGFNDGSQVEILEGVKPDEEVILIGKTPLVDNRAVKVTEAK